MSQRAEPITEACAHHGEGPVWHPAWPGPRWVDMHAGDVLTLDRTTGEVSRTHVGEVAAMLRPRSAGGVVLALERGFALADDDLGNLFPFEPLWTDHSVRMNDGGCAPDGSLFCGSMAVSEAPEEGSLFRLDPLGEVTIAIPEVTVSNGFAFSPDGGTAYYVDTPTQCVDAFDYVDYQLQRRRTVVRIDPADGAPDGLAVDAQGDIWVALWGGGAVRHYTPEGRLVATYEVPAPRVTACAFGGADYDELFITTSRVDTDLERYPRAGALFRIADVGPGAPVLPYGG
ncbi:SMP-30/gluconolactonase/LRE family protein [Salinifilum aidingensis]